MGRKKNIKSFEDLFNNVTCRVKPSDYREEELGDPQFFLPSGNYALDLALSDGRGYPGGVVMEFYGDEHTGKTSEWILFGIQVQKAGGVVILFEGESGFSKDLATLHGFNMDRSKFRVYRPKTMEVFCDMWEETCKAAVKLDVPVLVVVDSVAGLCPLRLSYEKVAMSKAERRLGEESRTLSWFFKRGFSHDIAGSKVFTVFVNQTRARIGGGRFDKGPSSVTPAGIALRFYAHIRLEFSEHSVQRNKHGNVVGAVKTIYTAKNKIIGKSRTIDVPVFYQSPWDDNKGLIHYLKHNQLFKAVASTGRYILDGVNFDGPLVKGEDSWLHKMRSSPKFREGMKKVVRLHYLQQWEEDDEWIKK